MQFQFNCHKVFIAAALFFGSATFAFGETAVEDAAQMETLEHDFKITSVTKDKTHPQYDVGDDVGFAVNGVQGGSLVLVRGKTYTFEVDTGVMHDFYLSTKLKGWGTGTLTKGVKGNFTYKGVVTFTPAADTPDTTYYACRNHKFMGGDIHIINVGEEGKFKGVESNLAR